MRCPICGREHPEEAKVCSHCGTDFAVFLESIQPKPAPAPAPARVSRPEANKQEKTKSRRPLWIAAVACIAVLGLLVAGVAGITSLFEPGPTTLDQPPVVDPGTSAPPPSTSVPPSTSPEVPPVVETGNYIASQQNLETLVTENRLVTFIGANPFYMVYDQPDLRKTQTSMDGLVHVFQQGQDLYLISDRISTRLYPNITDFTLSAEGSAVLTYFTADGSYSLFYYNEDLGVHVTVAQSPTPITSFCISPNGKYVACVSAFDGTYSVLQTFSISQSSSNPTEMTAAVLNSISANGDVLSISNDGAFVYYTQSFDETGTELCVLDKYGTQTLTDNFSGRPLILNADHTQAIYYAGGSYCMRYRYNHTGAFAEADGFEILLPEGCRQVSHSYASSDQVSTVTMPILEMNQMLYTQGSETERNLCMYYSIGYSQKLDEAVQQVKLTFSDFIYYIAGNTLKCAQIQKNSFVVSQLAADVSPDFLGATKDASIVFYVQDGGLWCTTYGAEENQLVASDIDGALVSSGGFAATDTNRDIFYIILDKCVFYCENENMKSLSIDNIFAVRNRYNTILLYSYSGQVYAVTGTKVTESSHPIIPALPK